MRRGNEPEDRLACMMVNGACDGGRGFGRGCGHDRGCETWSGSSSCRGRDLGRRIFPRPRIGLEWG